jgi:predicted signal transduction protein with EAL and GGDEF domain
VRSIIDLGHNLGLKVVAEGVETQEAQNMLRSYDCDEMQGYFYSRPIPADAVTKYLKTPPVEPTQSNVEAQNCALAPQSIKRKLIEDPKLQRLP